MKLLLGEQLAPHWHWGFNLFYEQETGGARATELGVSQAVSYSPLDSRLSVGVEMNFEHTTERGSRGDPAIEFLIGQVFSGGLLPEHISTLCRPLVRRKIHRAWKLSLCSVSRSALGRKARKVGAPLSARFR